MEKKYPKITCWTALIFISIIITCTTSNAQIINTIAGTGTASFSGDGGAAVSATFNGAEDVVVATNGDVYIADYSNNRVRKINTSGIISTIAGTSTGGFSGDGGPATAARLSGPSGLAIDGSGNIYIADRGNRRIRKINTTGIISTIAGTGATGYTGDGGPATAATFVVLSRLAVDKFGNIFLGDVNRCCVRKISAAGIITTIAGTGTSGYSGDGGPGIAAQITNPTGVAVDTMGNLYIADFSNARVRMVTPSGTISTFAGGGSSGSYVMASSASLNWIDGVTCDRKGNVYITGPYTNRIFKVSAAGLINIVAGTGTPGGFNGDGGPAVDAEFDRSTAISTDTGGNVYVIDYHNQRLRKFGGTCAPQIVLIEFNPFNARIGRTITLYDSTHGGTWSSSNSAIATVEGSGNVTGVALGRVTISYSLSNSCGTTTVTREVSVVTDAPPCDIVSSVAGMDGGTSASTGDGGPATAATFGSLWGLVLDAAGNIYTADYHNSVIRKTTASTGLIDVFAGTTGSPGYSGDGGPATAARVGYPSGMAIDGAGNIYICDVGYNTIRKVSTAGIITTIAGTGVAGFSGDNGPATAARISYPRGIAADATGNVYFLDGANFRIRQINSAGVIKTIAGRGVSGYTGDGGQATAAKLGSLWGLCTDAAGNLYCTDASYKIVRKISTAGIITTVAGRGHYSSGFSGDNGPATAASMSMPVSITADRYQNLYVGDYTHIRRVDATDTINSFAGTGDYIFTPSGIPALESSVNGVFAITTDTAGDVYYVNNSNSVKKITKNGIPYVAHIEGDREVCLGNTTQLFDSTPHGVWTSSNTAVATVDSSGFVTPLTAGTTIITYALHYSCGDFMVFDTLTVHGPVGPITGNLNACEAGGTTLLTDTTLGGWWSTSDSSIAYVDSSGMATGVSVGTVEITYTTGNSCFDTATITVNPNPSPIQGITFVCEGSSTMLTDTTAGGTWATSNAAIATVDGTGLVTGILAGLDTIMYILPTGCSAKTEFTVNPIPPAITGTTAFCQGSTTTLYNALPGGTWSSSDSTIARADTATGVITGINAGTATITYSRYGCPVTIMVTVYPYPASTITPIGDTTMCTGGFVVLAASSAADYSFQWYTGSTAISGETGDYTVVYATSGASSVSYRILITSSLGCSLLSPPITVATAPAMATITYTGPTTFCSGSSLTLNANTGTGLTYQWIVAGTAISGATNATYAATGSGATHVVVTNAAGCIASSASVTITALPVPDNTLTLSGGLTFCTGDSVRMSVPAATGVSYQWQIGGTNIAGATSNSYTATTTGNYAVITTNGYPCSSTSATAVVTALALPTATITASGATTICSGGTVTLSVPATAGNSYQWYRNGTTVSGATNAAYTAAVAGSYTVRVSSAAGCMQITPVPLLITEIADPIVAPLTSLIHCWGGNSVLGIASSMAGTTLQWYFNGTAITGATNATYNARPSGYYAVSVHHSSGGCSANSAWVYVTEHPLPNPIISWTGTQLRTGNFYATYQWFRNMTAVAGATTNTIVPYGTANYAVLVTDTNGCQSMSTGFPYPPVHSSLTDSAGSGGSGSAGSGTNSVEIQSAVTVAIFPNPANEVINIFSPVPVRAELHTADGRKVAEQQNAVEIDISHLAAGMYTLMIFNQEGVMLKVEKVIKQ